MLLPEEARAVLDAIDVSTIKGLRDRALIATMTYTFARVSATLADARAARLAAPAGKGAPMPFPKVFDIPLFVHLN